MAFDPKQEAIEIVGETEFYAFDFGNQIERYTSARKKVTAFGFTWLPIPLLRSGLDSQLDENGTKSKIVIPINPTFVDIVTKAGLETIKLTIIRGFGSDYDHDYKNPWWVGYLEDITVGIETVQGNLRSIETFFDVPMPRVTYMSGCNNNLYDPVCGVNPLTREETRTVVSLTNGDRVVTLTGTIQPNDYFTFGRMFKPGGDHRHILRQAGNQFVLHIPVAGLKVGDTVKVWPGCDWKASTCRTKFGNRNNYVGFPLIPAQNPVIDGF